MTTLSVAGFGAVLLVAALMMMFKRIGKKFVPWLMFVAGLCMSGAGLIGSLLDRAAAALARASESTSGRLFGVGLPLLIVVMVGIALFPHMRPKGQPPTRFTPWLALLFPSLLVVAGLGALASLFQSLGGELGTSAWATVMDVVKNSGR